jgi:hypothetical protein
MGATRLLIYPIRNFCENQELFGFSLFQVDENPVEANGRVAGLLNQLIINLVYA